MMRRSSYREFQVNMRTERVFHQVAFRAFWPALISTLIITDSESAARDKIPNTYDDEFTARDKDSSSPPPASPSPTARVHAR